MISCNTSAQGGTKFQKQNAFCFLSSAPHLPHLLRKTSPPPHPRNNTPMRNGALAPRPCSPCELVKEILSKPNINNKEQVKNSGFQGPPDLTKT